MSKPISAADRSAMPFENLQAADLIPIVAKVVDRPLIDALDWQMEPLSLGGSRHAGGLGLTRLFGTAACADEMIPWSLIAKGFDGSDGAGRSSLNSRTPTACSYWKREILAYDSGILADLAGPLVAPACYAVTEHPGDHWLLWMEEVEDRATDWGMKEHGLAARHFGQFNGSYLTDRSLAAKQPWFSQGRARDPFWFGVSAQRSDEFQRYAASEVGRRWVSQESVVRMRRLYDNRHDMVQMLDRAPTTLCHHDAYCHNLMMRTGANGGPQTVAIDWSMLGYGALGEDPAVITANALVWLVVEADQAAALDQTVFHAYVEGLCDAGWQGDLRLVRYGYTTAVALVFGVALATLIGTVFATDEAVGQLEATFGHSRDEIVSQLAVAQPFLLDLGDEALQLMEELT